MGINKVPAGQNISESPDVVIASLAEGETLAWNATTSKWNNGLPHTITTPTFTAPAGGSILTASVASTFTTSSYSIAPTNTLLTHVATDWQLALNADFSTISIESLADASNKTSWTVTIPSGTSPVYVRARYINQTGEKSAYGSTSYAVYQSVVYNTSGNFVTPANTNTVDVWAVGAGGGGAGGGFGGCGGGVTATSGVAVTPGTTYSVTVGTGGACGNSGVNANSAGGSSNFRNVTGSGANANTSGNGFAKSSSSGPYGPNGTNGRVYGGGGGAGAVGGNPSFGYPGPSNAGAGGAGVNVTYDSVRRGGGGAGGGTQGGYNNNYVNTAAAVDGGGSGAGGRNSAGPSGTNGRGGGGSASVDNPTSGTGGNGVVILRYTV
jgi:hypothetical protein